MDKNQTQPNDNDVMNRAATTVVAALCFVRMVSDTKNPWNENTCAQYAFSYAEVFVAHAKKLGYDAEALAKLAVNI